jgi:hypothetical protein
MRSLRQAACRRSTAGGAQNRQHQRKSINPLTKKVVIAGVEDLDTEQAGMLIEELHLIAAEYNIILIEV